MYLINNEITVTWILPPTDTPLAASDYDIRITTGSLEGTYTDAGIINYTAPTSESGGSIQYQFTPLAQGRYRLNLTTGLSTGCTRLDEKSYWVFGESPVTAGNLKVLSKLSYPVPIINPPPIVSGGAGWEDIYEIFDMKSDGTNILFSAARQNTTKAIWKTDHQLSAPVEVAAWNVTNFSNAVAQRELQFVEYIPSLDRWITATDGGDVYYSDDTGATWTACTMYTPGWSLTAADTLTVHWNPHLGYLYVASSDFSTMQVSTDGITFGRQQDLQVLGGSHPYKLYDAGTYNVNGKKIHILSQWEEYCWKDVDTGGSTGWTKTPNQGVIGDGGTWTLSNWETDGATIMVSAFDRVAMNEDPTVHANWVEYTIGDMGIGTEDIHGLMYIPEFDRPWIMCQAGSGLWWDLDSVTKTTAPLWQPTTNPYFAGKGAVKTAKWSSRSGKWYNDLGNGKWGIIFNNFDNVVPTNTVKDEIMIGA